MRSRALHEVPCFGHTRYTHLSCARPGSSTRALLVMDGGNASADDAATRDELRARLVRFYGRYNPGKIPQVDATLDKYVGREPRLFAALVEQYGPEPEEQPQQLDDAAATGADPALAGLSVRERLSNMYSKYNPAKLPTVDDTVERYRGRERQLFALLVGKYGPEPPPSMDTAAAIENPATRGGASGVEELDDDEATAALGDALAGIDGESAGAGDARAQLLELLEAHDPAKLPAADAILAKFAGREAALLRFLRHKYAV